GSLTQVFSRTFLTRTSRWSGVRPENPETCGSLPQKGLAACPIPKSHTVPSYRLHKQSGQAVVTLTDGLGSRRDVLRGRHSSAESHAEYKRVILEWDASGRRLLPTSTNGAALSVNEIILAYWQHVETYYRHSDGTATTEVGNIRLALRPLKALYGH